MAQNYDKIFGSNATFTYAWNDADYLTGWESIGNLPPTAAQFNELHKTADLKAQDLNTRTMALEAVQKYLYRQASTAYAVGKIVLSDSLPNGMYLECTKAGTTSAGGLTIASPASGVTVTDGTATWKVRKVGDHADTANKATALQTARTINGTSFNGTANITTVQWGTARNIKIADSAGANTGAGVSVNGGADVTLKLPATIAANLSGKASTAGTADSVAWNGVTGKPSTFAPAAHNHDSSYPSTSGARASGTWGINITGKANTAGTADTLAGLTHVGGLDWGVQTGSYVTSMDISGCSMGFRKNCPTNGQLSMVIDGAVYQNEGQYKCIDESTISSQSVKHATSADKATNVTQRKSASSVTHADYANNQTYLPDMSFMAYWNGAYNSNGSSNLKYSANGEIIGKNNIAQYGSAPTGAIIMYAGKNTPSGYLLCDGSKVSRTTYATLFKVIGTTYGAGDGSKTFQLPLLTDSRFIEGQAAPGAYHNAGLPSITIPCSGWGGLTAVYNAPGYLASPKDGADGHEVSYAINEDRKLSMDGTMQPKSLALRPLIKY